MIRFLKRAAVAAGVFVASMAIGATAALAQEYTIDLAPALNTLIEGLGAVLLAALTAVAGYLMRKLKLDGDAQVRAYVDAALANGVEWGVAKVKSKSQEIGNLEVKNEAIAIAAGYVLKNVPGGLKKLGIDERRLVDLTRHRMERLLGT